MKIIVLNDIIIGRVKGQGGQLVGPDLLKKGMAYL